MIFISIDIFKASPRPYTNLARHVEPETKHWTVRKQDAHRGFDDPAVDMAGLTSRGCVLRDCESSSTTALKERKIPKTPAGTGPIHLHKIPRTPAGTGLYIPCHNNPLQELPTCSETNQQCRIGLVFSSHRSPRPCRRASARSFTNSATDVI